LSRYSAAFALSILLCVIGNLSESWAQMSTVRDAISFFRHDPPTDTDLAGLPKTARDVVIAKVRIVGRVSYLGGRDVSGLPPPGPRTKDLFGARIQVLEVLSGPIVIGAESYVVFGEPSVGRDYIFPITPRMRELPYFIASFTDQDAVHRLVGFNVSRSEYEEWHNEWLEYERMRGRPGAQD
jgi:hypothetical protein